MPYSRDIMLKRTPLYQAHAGMGAKLVDFGGWEMPLHYGSQIDEHHRVRSDCGMFDVSHMQVLDVRGKDCRSFLRHLVANNVDKLVNSGKALYSAMLNPEGGVVDDLIIYYLEESWFRIVVNAGTAEKDIAWMKEQSSGFSIDIAPRRDLAMIAVQGPNGRAKVWQAIPGSETVTAELGLFHAAEFGPYFIARTGYTGEDGFEIILPSDMAGGLWKALNEAGVTPIGLGARDTLRLEAGMNLYGQDMDEMVNPLEAGLAWTVDLKSERDFVGKAALLSKPVKFQLAGLVLLDKGVLRSHQKVSTSHGEGEITSGSFSPTLGKSIAFARIPVEVGMGEEVQVAVRDKLLRAKVVKYPFARNGKSLI